MNYWVHAVKTPTSLWVGRLTKCANPTSQWHFGSIVLVFFFGSIVFACLKLPMFWAIRLRAFLICDGLGIPRGFVGFTCRPERYWEVRSAMLIQLLVQIASMYEGLAPAVWKENTPRAGNHTSNMHELHKTSRVVGTSQSTPPIVASLCKGLLSRSGIEKQL